MVTRTSRLLKYNLVHDMLSKYANTGSGFEVRKSEGVEKIIIHNIHDDIFGTFKPTLEDLRGITFYTDSPEKTEIWIEKNKINSNEIQINNEDQTGKRSIAIKWYAPDTIDYTQLSQ
ncbi:hypothetical protein SD70_15790 [Gordoniibacillus kamchatkensis]|uniref:Uncharacterized protein n=1 Tax=Gordoniibacillus kamchatkensis TaxID=1590651 RepID=A0ABR5AGH9_9BACL|nr:hypothetical protein SD70_15790 [Paenibacillus sp. VKM B-2647]